MLEIAKVKWRNFLSYMSDNRSATGCVSSIIGVFLAGASFVLLILGALLFLSLIFGNA